MNPRLLYFVSALIFCQMVFSQELPNITPPSPIAYELGKYGQIPTGMFTGTPNPDIPIYNYQSGKLSVSISLSYNSNGIKVDQLSSNVGLGWNLNIGGVITRIVKDKSDEDRNVLYPEREIHDVGLNSPMALDYFYLAGQPDSDTETDIFMYNFLGYSGSFVFDQNGSIVMIPNKDILIEQYTESNLLGFKAITKDGVQYIFLDSETSENTRSGDGYHPTPEFNTTSWYLTKMIHPNGDQINFIYNSLNYTYVISQSQSLTVPTPLYQNGCEGNSGTGPGYVISPEVTDKLTIMGKQLVEINSNNLLNGKILINSNTSHPEISGYKLVSNLTVKDNSNSTIESFDFSYLLTTNKRAFLEEIAFKNPNKKYSFEYIEPQGFVGRLSKAQDFYGYYNGITTNTYWFPNPQNLPFMPNELSFLNIGANKSVNVTYAQKGLLKKITYPTNGFSEFSYESNTYWGANTTLPAEQNLILNIGTAEAETGSSYQDTGHIPTILFNQRTSFSIYVTFNSQECSEDVLKSKVEVVITDDQTGNNVSILEQRQAGYFTRANLFAYNDSENTFYVDLVAGHSYTIKLTPKYFCTNAIFNLEYYDQALTTQKTNLTSGGLRVSEIKSYPNSSSSPNIKKYYYGKKEALDQSSGEPGKEAYYLSKQTNLIPCGGICGYLERYYTTLNSTTLRPLFNSASNGTTYYKYVTVSHGGNDFENGGEENEFIIHNDYPGNPLKGNPIESSTWVNAGWSNGLLKKKTIFKYNDLKTGFLNINQTINNYIQDNRHFKQVYGYTVNKKFDFLCASPVTYSCTASDSTKQFEYRRCFANHKHWYLTVSSRNCIASGHNNISYWFQHPCYGMTVGSVVTSPESLDNLDIMEYTNNSYWHYLNQTIEKQFDQNGLNPIETVTNYYYDNPQHLQLSKTETTNSTGETLKTNYTYPPDLISEPFMLELTAANRLTPPVSTEQYKNNSLISKSKTTYANNASTSNLLLPKSIYQAKFPNVLPTIANIGQLEKKITYDKYDDKGNILQYTPENASSVSIIWGYNKTQPIAKIENISYSSINSSYITAAQSASDTGTETSLLTALNSLRNSLPSNTMITTYTYKPLNRSKYDY